ncbi:MAG: hypothetical protein OXU69_13120 [Gemmatimonadota bacterium]|nr:hypothetical protein [Gemmatimonadota bacterium]MDE2985641.1 hypothetical protein [Gemmatimonadota bacterium]
MRRLSTLLLAAAPLLPGPPASGQSTFTLHGGPNRTMLAEIYEDTLIVVPRVPIVGMQASLGVSFRFTPPDAIYTFGVRVSGTYAQRGSAHEAIDHRILVRMHYMLVSVQYDMRFPFRWDRLTTNVVAGPAFGGMFFCDRQFEDAGGAIYDTRPCRDGEFRKLDFALILGGNLELAVTDRLGITTGLQYHWGARDIENHVFTRMLNRTLALQGGLVYHLR